MDRVHNRIVSLHTLLTLVKEQNLYSIMFPCFSCRYYCSGSFHSHIRFVTKVRFCNSRVVEEEQEIVL